MNKFAKTFNKYSLNGSRVFRPYTDCERTTVNQARYVHVTNASAVGKWLHVVKPGTRLGFLTANGITVANTGPSGKTQITVGSYSNPLSLSNYATSTYSGNYYYKNTWVITGEKNNKNFYETDGPLCLFFEKNLILNNKKGNWVIASKLDHDVFGQKVISTDLIHWYANGSSHPFPDNSTSFTEGSAVLESGLTYVLTNNTGAAIGSTDLSTDGNRALFVSGTGADSEVHQQLMYQTAIKTNVAGTLVDAAQYKSNPKDNKVSSSIPREYHLTRKNKWYDTVIAAQPWMWTYERSTYSVGAGTDTFVNLGTNTTNISDAVCPASNWHKGTTNAAAAMSDFSINDRVNTLNTLVPEVGMRLFGENIHPTTNQDVFIENVEDVGSSTNHRLLTLNQTISMLTSANTQNLRLSFDFNIPDNNKSLCLERNSVHVITKEPHEEIIITDGRSLASTMITSGTPVALQKVNKAEIFI